jgi:hypothetical protein
MAVVRRHVFLFHARDYFVAARWRRSWMASHSGVLGGRSTAIQL